MTKSGMGRCWGVSAVLVSVALTGCGREPTEAESLAAARKSLAENKPRAAVIQIRNALQQNAKSAEARFLMGQALLANGEVLAAQDEFRRARAEGLSDAEVVPALAGTMVLAQQEKKLVEEFGATSFNDNKRADADLALSLAKAHDVLGDAVRAQQLLERSLQAKPDFQPAVLSKVRAIAAQQGADAALAELQSKREMLSKNAEAAYLEGAILLNGKQDVDGAVAAFKRSVALAPKAIDAHASLIAVYLHKKDLEAVRKQVEALKQAQPNTPAARVFEAEVALLDGDAKKARALAMGVLQTAPKSVRAMYIAAAAELQLRSSFQAITMLQKALAQQPELVEASKLLARAYVHSGQPKLALKALEQPLERSPNDRDLLSTAAEAHMQLADAAKAESFYKRALAQRPDDAQTKTALALAVMAKGQESEGLNALSVVAREDASPVADMVLISSYIARNRLDQALESVDQLDRKQSDKPAAPFSRGRILLLKGDNTGARAAFEEALKRDDSYIPAMNNLALLDLRDGKSSDARARFEAVLKANPNNVAALMSLADVLAVQNAPQADVTALLERAVAADPVDPAPHQMLIEFLLQRKSPVAAVAAGQKAVALINSHPELYNALGRAQSAVGEGAQAQASFAKQAQLQPAAAGPYLSAADAYRRAGDRANTVKSLRQALSINPQLLAAQEALFDMELRAEHFPAALAIARDVQKQRPLSLQGYQWEGAVYEAQRRWDQATSTYKRGIDRLRAENRDAFALAGRQHQVLLAINKGDDAGQFAQNWVRVNPRDVGFRIYLGDASLASRDWAAAEQHYRSVLEIEPNNALAANNVAAMLVRLNRPGAVEMAQRAVKLAPTSADAFDTLAMALAADKQWEPAINAQRKSIALAPRASAPKIKLAKLLIDAGKKTEAETELRALEALGGKFERQSEVSALLKQI